MLDTIHLYPSTNCFLQMMITVTVNGVAMSSKEIPEVSGTGHIYTAPKLGYPPAVGVTRDMTIMGEWDYSHNAKQTLISSIYLEIFAF